MRRRVVGILTVPHAYDPRVDAITISHHHLGIIFDSSTG
jgi:hypothetical protein